MWVILSNDHKGRPRYYETAYNIVFTMDKDAVYVEHVEKDNGWAALEWDITQQLSLSTPAA
jgi:hypothetical protein